MNVIAMHAIPLKKNTKTTQDSKLKQWLITFRPNWTFGAATCKMPSSSDTDVLGKEARLATNPSASAFDEPGNPKRR